MLKIANSGLRMLLLGISLSILAAAVVTDDDADGSGVGDIVKLSKDGGYHLVVAVNEQTQLLPYEMMKYLQNVQDRIQTFSEHLFTATRGQFYIRKLDILIPWSWTIEVPSTPQGISFATTQSYETADIRLYEGHENAHVENPNPCGFTGQYIELPLSFFDNEVHPRYGPTWKALLNQWARYRWGVWEEHGEPGNESLPYFYRKPNGTSWLVTGCSDALIAGNVTNQSGETCDLNSDAAPATDCRLRPENEGQTATSSLMHFHWLDSVKEFCDYELHDSESPNRQNKYCGHRSVWEVIEGSVDYRRVREPVSVVPKVEYTLMVRSRRPLLYLLIDQGRNNIAEYVLDEVFGNLTKLFDLDVEQQVVASIGTYPTKLGAHDCHVINENVHWKLIRDNHEDFADSLHQILIETKYPKFSNPPIRNFGEAVLAVVRDINARGSLAGGVLLVLKTGAGENTFDKVTPEAEVLTALDEKQNIIVHAIEMPNSDSKPYTNNLKRIVQKTGGQHAVVSKSYHIVEQMIPLINHINEYLKQPTIYPQATHRQQVFYNGELQPGMPVSFPVHTEDLTSLQFYFTLPTHIDANKIQLTASDHPYQRMTFDESRDWNEDDDYRRRTLYTFHTTLQIESTQTWTLEYECRGTEAECRGHLIAYGFVPTLSETNDQIDVAVSTSAAAESIVDLSLYAEPTFVAVPFSIFAKVTRSRQPIRNVAVEATVEYLEQDGMLSTASPSTWKVKLLDDGFGTPDIAANDGIYSGVFIPDRDGFYKIHVTVESTRLSETPAEEHVSVSNLLPVDQQYIGCSPGQPDCRSILVQKPFRKVVHLQSPVCFINSKTYVRGRPFRITDLEVIANSNFFITFKFTTPRLIGAEGGATQFNFYMSPRLKTLIGTGLGNQEIMVNIGGVPGTKMSIQIPALEEVTAYYAVEALNGPELRSGSSNIFGVKTRLIGQDPTTTTTTTTPAPTPTQTPTTTLTPTPTTAIPRPTPTTTAPVPTTTAVTRPTTTSTPTMGTTARPLNPSSTSTTEPLLSAAVGLPKFSLNSMGSFAVVIFFYFVFVFCLN